MRHVEMTNPMAMLRDRLRRFRRDERGSMIVFGMFIMIMMMMVGGMAVDLMRYETNRTRLQSTLDRAILAAADLDAAETNADAEAVAEDHFAKAGLDADSIFNVTATGGVNSRVITATASLDLDTYFMGLVGVDLMTAPAAGVAEQSVRDIEIIMVLDVSGSMLNNNRLRNLKTAANEFIVKVLENDIDNRISIGIVPFNGQVNLGLPLRTWQTGITDVVTSPLGVNCVDLPPSVYESQSITRVLSMPATQHADTYSTTNRSNAYYAFTDNRPALTNVWCPPSTVNTVRLPTRDASALHARINGLTAVGATSINAGMRWGMTLIDPNSDVLFDHFITSNAVPVADRVPVSFDDRPYAFDRDDTMKIIVLMTDGEHFAEERVNEGYRSGDAPIWRANLPADDDNPADTNFSIRHASGFPTGQPFWVPHRSSWSWRAWNGSASGMTSPPAQCANNNDAANDPDGKGVCNRLVGTVVRQKWPEVWSAVRMHWVAWQMYGRPFSTTSEGRIAAANAQMNAFRTQTPVETMDSQLQQMCDRARDEAVMVFGVAFEAPAGGKTQIYDCASTPSHYYESSGTGIVSDFNLIAGQISALRLVQ